MYPFSTGKSVSAKKVSIQINFDKNIVNCLVDGKKKGLIFNGPKDLKNTSFGLFVETKNQGSRVEILNDEIKLTNKRQKPQFNEKLEEKIENLVGSTAVTTRDQTRENSDGE